MFYRALWDLSLACFEALNIRSLREKEKIKAEIELRESLNFLPKKYSSL